MIYTPHNTHPSCVFTKESTDATEYNRVFLVDTSTNELHNYTYPLSWSGVGVLNSNTYKYSSIDVALDEHGFPVEFILKGLIK
jgi:hypothetical protein